MKIAPFWNCVLTTFMLLLWIWEVCPYFPLVLISKALCAMDNRHYVLMKAEVLSPFQNQKSNVFLRDNKWYEILLWVGSSWHYNSSVWLLNALCPSYCPYFSWTRVCSESRSSWVKRGFAYGSAPQPSYQGSFSTVQ